MGTAIEWAENPDGSRGETWNPVVGCSLASLGCSNCYAQRMAGRLEAMGQQQYAGLTQVVNGQRVWTGEVRCLPERLAEPLTWRKPRRVFVNSMSDLFHPDVPDAFLDQVFAVMALCPQHTFQVLTKRAKRMQAWFARYSGGRDHNCADFVADAMASRLGRDGARGADRTADHPFRWPLPNVWLGVSVEDQRRADERIPHLLRTPAAVRFLSCEPLLGPVDLTKVALGPGQGEGTEVWTDALAGAQFCCDSHAEADVECNRVDWVIVGGESGHDARPCDLAWVRSLVAQCRAAGVPAFVKQLGARPVTADLTHCRGASELLPDGSGYALRLRDRKGGAMQEWPADLRVREFPQPARGREVVA